MFEDLIKQLEEIVNKLEKGDVTLNIDETEQIIKRENISQVKIHFEF